jgi:hypothetical protein
MVLIFDLTGKGKVQGADSFPVFRKDQLLLQLVHPTLRWRRLAGNRGRNTGGCHAGAQGGATLEEKRAPTAITFEFVHDALLRTPVQCIS